MFFKKWGVAVVAVAFLVVAAIAVLVYGNRTEHYHELSLTGEGGKTFLCCPSIL